VRLHRRSFGDLSLDGDSRAISGLTSLLLALTGSPQPENEPEHA
jgi:hypothetical protein